MIPIQLSYTSKEKSDLMEQFSLNILPESSDDGIIDLIDYTDLYCEAVFKDGKTKVQPILEVLQKIKSLLEEKVKEANDAYKKLYNERRVLPEEAMGIFDTEGFWRHQYLKDFEDVVQNTFGFRSVEIAPYIDDYDPTDGKFKFPTSSGNYQEASMSDVMINYMNRYPIEGILTDDGFFDKSRSITMSVRFSLSFLHAVTPEEAMGVFLHEFGHSIDPAVVDIRYTEVNILSKYLTDRQGALNAGEKKYIAKNKFEEFAVMGIIVGIWAVGSVIAKIVNFFKRKKKDSDQKRRAPDEIAKKIKSIRKTVQKSPTFNRQNYGEAFADNFARMYGYGPQVISALHKMKRDDEKKLRSLIEKEADRQKAILEITEAALGGVHKTNIHRIRSLLKEYKADLADPRISNETKNIIREDMGEVEKLLDQYLNNFSEFQSRVNRIINEELIRIENKEKKFAKPVDHTPDKVPEETPQDIPIDTEGAIEAMRGKGSPMPVTEGKTEFLTDEEKEYFDKKSEETGSVVRNRGKS